MWKVNAGRRSVFADEFLSRKLVAIGWRTVGDYSRSRSRDDVVRLVAAGYPDYTEKQVDVAAFQIWRFLNEIKVGDRVITYDPTRRLYHLGTVVGEPRYAPDDIEDLPVSRQVDWQSSVSRDTLSDAARGKLGAILTLYKVAPSTAAELEARARNPNAPVEGVPDESEEPTLEEAVDPYAEIQERALERIKDRLRALDWAEMQEIVAALLRALGYRTIVSPAGPDRGKDIVASKDGFGFESPRIVVEVKHRREPMGAPEIRAFLGGRHSEDRGLYVSTGGFTREAHFEAERASTVTHLMTLDGLAQSLIDNYDLLDERGRVLMPLVRIYWPTS